MKMLTSCFVFSLLLAPLALAQAEPKPQQKAEEKPESLNVLTGRPDVQGEELLGGTFQNAMAGIAFRVPASCQQIHKVEDEIARFASADKSWEMVVTRQSSAQPLALSGDEKRMGLLEVVAARLKQSHPNIEMLRQDTVNLGESEAGILTARITVGSQKKLLQEALVQANDQLYYTIALTSPAAKDAKGADSSDPAERIAVESFRQMIDTVKLLDRTVIKDDQNERLVRTRALFVTLHEKKLRATIIPEQWLRLMSDGKDIGYTYIVEELGAEGPNEGIRIGIRSRSYPEKDVQVDGETWYFVSFDRKHETWRSLAWVQNLATKQSDQFTEIGSSDRRVKRTVDTSGQVQLGEGKDLKQPPVVATESSTMQVQRIGKAKNAEPLKQELPPWYLPQALGHLLPRLVPLTEPKTYMFAVYVSDQGHVMHRYVDVGTVAETDLAGKRVRAIPISDRIGLEGTPTLHYMSEDGKYLGSVNKESKITILPADASSLQKIWANRADLTRPRDVPPPAAP
jgi:hypothetical protein